METIGKYRIEEKIGSGGFGEVFRGYDPLIKRPVAIKICGSDDQEIAKRFSREAEIGGNLHHRNITTVYDFGVHDERPYLVQEYLTGEDLDVKIKRRDYLPYSEKLLYLLQIARGLAYAHAHGVIHRDVKPANVRILEDGTAKLLDFGIAKLAQHESGLTQTGMTLGTAAYLAPEQVRGEAVDLRTDIFSFGVLAYELITYERPFVGEQISTVIYNLLHREPEPLTAHWPGAPPGLVSLVDRCMRKDAGQRFADGNGLVQELERLKRSGAAVREVEATTRRLATGQAATSRDSASAATRELTAHSEPPRGDRPATSMHGASGLEYRLPPEQSAEGAPDIPAQNTKKPALGGVAILVLLTALAASGGWWLGTRDQPADSSEPPPPIADRATDDDAAAVTSPPAAEADLPLADLAEPPPTTESQPAVETETPSEPPPPTTGRLVLPRVPWTDRMTARIDGRTYPLNRRHEIELAPGTYSAVFHFGGESLPGDTPIEQYNPANRSVEIRVEAGKSSSVDAPIPPPGALSVRPLPGRAQGRVTLDGELLGPTPLSGIQREPGAYTLEILPHDSDEGGLEEQITLETGRELILSFDLGAGTVESRAKGLIL